MLICLHNVFLNVLTGQEGKMRFAEIWKVFSTGLSSVYGIDCIALSAVFRIAEMQLRNNNHALAMRQDFLQYEPEVSPEDLDHLIEVIKENTYFDGTVVYNTGGRRRYENLPDVAMVWTPAGRLSPVLLSSFD
jgi:hypothetical protein